MSLEFESNLRYVGGKVNSGAQWVMFENFFKPRFLKHLEKGNRPKAVQMISFVNANTIVEKIDESLVRAKFEQRVFYVWIASMQVIIREINEVQTKDAWKSAARQLLMGQMKELQPSAIEALLDCFKYIESKANPGKGLDEIGFQTALGEWIIWRLDFDKSRVKPDTALAIGAFIDKWCAGYIHQSNR